MIGSSIFAHSIAIAAGGTVQRVLSAGSGPGTGEGAPTESVILKARKGNTSSLYLGSATTGGGTSGSGLTSATGFELQPGDAVAVDIMGLGNAWIIGATTNDKYDILAVGA